MWTGYNKIGLKKTAYFMNILSNTEYFHFVKPSYGPFDHSIELITKNIKESQKYYGVNRTEETKSRSDSVHTFPKDV